MKHHLLSIALIVAMIVGFVNPASACTNYLITKGASVDGSTMISYAADSHVLYGDLYHWPAGTWEEGTMMDIYEWDTGKFLGQIKQASETLQRSWKYERTPGCYRGNHLWRTFRTWFAGRCHHGLWQFDLRNPATRQIST